MRFLRETGRNFNGLTRPLIVKSWGAMNRLRRAEAYA
jgi:hypothetical protein